jgi:hypothetical protein
MSEHRLDGRCFDATGSASVSTEPVLTPCSLCAPSQDGPMTEPSTERTRVKRAREKARYDRGVVDEIFDEALICHAGFVADGSPFVIPTIHARVGDTLYIPWLS